MGKPGNGWATTGVDETIASLQQRCTEIVEDSYAYLNLQTGSEYEGSENCKKDFKGIIKASDPGADLGA